MEDQIPKRGFTGLWIPAAIVQDNRLTLLEKLLYAEIDALDKGNDDKGCFASNAYLAKIIGSTERSISNAISNLKSLGLLGQKSFDGRQRLLKSYILPSRILLGSLVEKVEADSIKTTTIYNSIENSIEIPLTPFSKGEQESELAMEARYGKPKRTKRANRTDRSKQTTTAYPDQFDLIVALFQSPGNVKEGFRNWEFCQTIDGEKPESVFQDAEKYTKLKGQFAMRFSDWIEQRRRKTKLRASTIKAKAYKTASNILFSPSVDSLLRNAPEAVKRVFSDSPDKWRLETINNGWSPFQLMEAIQKELDYKITPTN